ncbi:PdaC/SigV domain-containing protein [Pontibacillus salicampi]|uniref:PdaC/SigV domain-containing protein n=1 Tax=Pontibacillus salicampi TaxID=1449801 RepID=A0ABV6LQ15_9BACI
MLPILSSLILTFFSVWSPSNQGIEVDKRIIEEKGDYYNISVEYPLFKDNRYGSYLETINNVFEQQAQEKFHGSKEHAEVYQYLAKKREVPLEYSSSFTVPLNQNGLLSVLYKHYEFSNGPKDFSYPYAKTFDLQSEKELALFDLFQEHTHYKDFLFKKITKELQKYTNNADFKSLGERPKYYLKPSCLVIFALPGEYLPINHEIPYIEIGYEELRPYLKKEYKKLLLQHHY